MKIASSRASGLVAVVLVAVLSASCSGQTPPTGQASSGSTGAPLSGQTWAVGGVLDASPMFKALTDGIVDAGKNAGAKMLRYDNAVEAAKEVSNARLMVQQGANVVIDWAAGGGADAAGGAFKNANIPCVGIATPIPSCAFYNIDTQASGTGLAEATAAEATKRGWDPAKTTLLLVSCLGCGGPDHQTLEYFYSTYAAAFPQAFEQRTPSQVTIQTTTIGNLNAIQVDGTGTLEGANSAVTKVVQSIPAERKIVVYANNDDMATGALRALDQAGRTKNTILGAQGSTPAALDAVRTGTGPWVAESSLFLSAWPRYLVALGMAVKDGASTPDVTKAPGVIVTAANMNEWFNADGSPKKEPALPSGDEFLKPYFAKIDKTG